ncbi:CCHC-type domain-containing protein [Citrus sinensis]|nr:CCHC-type domain-containing protein [Citrus sinensis]
MATSEKQPEVDISSGYASMSIDEEEESGLILEGDDIDGGNNVKIEYRFCLVGRFLTDKVINFAAMKNTMASLWRPGKGVCIKEVSPTLFLFQFFHEIDVKRVLEVGPWTFDQHILLVKRLEENEQPQLVPLFFTSFWIHIYNLPIGFMSEKVLKHIGNYVGTFVDSDENNFMGVWRTYMRIRVAIDVRKPLKHKMKLKKEGGEWFWIDFKYERLNIFCFICGLLGHTEKQCPKLYDYPSGEIVKAYGHWMKVPLRKNMMNSGERWLRSALPEEAEFGKGNSITPTGVMMVDSITSLNPGDYGPRTKERNVSAGFEGSDMEGSSMELNRGHLRINEKSAFGTINVSSGSKEFEEDQETGIIVNNSKRRRSQGGPRSIGGQEEEPSKLEMDAMLDPKNGKTVGPVTQAHRKQ